MIAALYVDPNGPYPSLLGPGMCWDAARDARTYPGPWPVIVHPPCARWGPLAAVNQKRWGTPIGSDGGLFAHALRGRLLT